MVLNDSMLSAAFRYREIELWKTLEDSDLFAVSLSTGEIGYCSVMGNAGEHFALGLYIGDLGFSTYLKTISMANKEVVEMHEASISFDCINCDFVNANDMTPQSKKIIKAYVASHGVKVRRPKGWPDFARYSPYKMPWSITKEEDAQAITEALEVSAHVAEMLKTHSREELGFVLYSSKPTEKGGKVVPYLIPQADGTYQWSTTKLPALCPDVYPKPSFNNDILAHKLKSLRKTGTFQCRFVHVPPVFDANSDEAPCFLGLMLCLDEESGALLPPLFLTDGNEKKPDTLLNDLANIFSSDDACPAMILVADGLTKSLLNDFCKKCGIAIKKKSSLAELNDAYAYVMSSFFMR